MLEAAERRAIGLAVAGVIGVHEDVGAGLDFVPDAGLRLQLVRAGAGTADDLAVQPGMGETLDGVARGEPRSLDRLAPLVDGAHMLGGAMIGLNAREAQRVGAGDRFREPDGAFAGRDAAAPAADIDLDIDVERDILAGCRLRRLAHAVGVIDAQAHAGAAGQPGQPVELGGARDLVGHQHVADAARDQDFGLRDLLAALPHRPVCDLAQGDLGALMGLRMGPKPDAVRLGEGCHGNEVALEGIEIEDEGRRFDFGEALAGLGRRR